MAESVVSSVIRSLTPLLLYEAELLRNVHKEIASIKDELESIKYFLKDADLRSETDESAKSWVKQVREVAYQIEDVIDEYILRLAEKRQRRGFINFLRHMSRSIRKLKPRHEIASQIQDIKASIREIKERADRYKFTTSDRGSGNNRKENLWHDPRVDSLFIEEDEVVGIQPHRDEVIGRLVDQESKQVVISILGMAGVGKTTLARKVYSNQTESGHFDCCAWIPVSQSYKTDELLRTMLKEFYQSRKVSAPQGIDAMDQNSLIGKLREYLREKRYFIVFDDVWGTDFWGFIRNSLPRNDKGSRVIITTRIEEVAALCGDSPLDHIHELRPLSEEHAWKLFCMKAFKRDFGGSCPPELEEVSRGIVRKCEGLPLAIVAIGGILSTKNKVVYEWQKFYKCLGYELERIPYLNSITKIVLLSYHDLPHYLKSCFLYFGILPEDYSIKCGRLIRLWIAEGFIEEQEGKTLEEVAEEYLIELIHRSLVQVSTTKFDGRVKSCRVHDIVREIILSKSKELSFCQVLAEENSSFNSKTRRLSIHMHHRMDKVLESISKSRIRSVFLISTDQLPKKQPLLGTLAANFKLLKVLDLEGAPLDELDEEVGNLFHLRYLSVRRTKVKVIPKSIGKLQNLETLDLKHSLVCELPIEINRLRKLQYLLAYYFSDGFGENIDSLIPVRVQGGIGHLEDLQKLFIVELDVIKDLENLRQLRKLCIAKLKRDDGRALGTAIEKMKHLQNLNVWPISEDEVLDLHSISSPPVSLQTLLLCGRLEKLPNWIPKLQNLSRLRLNWSGLTDDPMKALQALPNLELLTLDEGYDGEQLRFEVGGFQKLKRLNLRDLKGLNSLIIEKGSLPILEELLIRCIPQLKKVPSGIHHLRKLTTLHFADMPMELLDRMKPNKEGQDCWIVEHIPNVKFLFTVSGRPFYTAYTPQQFEYAPQSQQES